MKYPLNNVSVVSGGQFGSDPGTYAQFNLAGHNGVDLVASVGTPLFAPEDATVLVSSNGTTDQYTGAGVAGELIVLKGTSEHWLLHLSRRNVFKGDVVKEGQLIGLTGNTGFVDPAPTPAHPNWGEHLHWGVRPLYPNVKNGYRGFINPMEFMKGIDMQADAQNIVYLYRGLTGESYPADDKHITNYVGKPWPEVILSILKYMESNGKDYASLKRQLDQGKGGVAPTPEQVLGGQIVNLIREASS